VRTATLRPLTILPQFCTSWCTKLRKHVNATVEVFHCFTVAIGLPRDASDYNEDIRSTVAARMQSSEATVRARSEILDIWAALKQLSGNKNDAMCVVLLRLTKTKNLNMLPSFVNIGTSPDRTEQSFSGRMF